MFPNRIFHSYQQDRELGWSASFPVFSIVSLFFFLIYGSGYGMVSYCGFNLQLITLNTFHVLSGYLLVIFKKCCLLKSFTHFYLLFFFVLLSCSSLLCSDSCLVRYSLRMFLLSQ